MSNLKASSNFLNLLQNRELQKYDWRHFSKKSQVLPSFINRLNIAGKLEGHFSCVNCIEFNKSGNLLLSGSDDYCIILWDVHRQKLLKSLPTGHRGNIFSVKFLPHTNDSAIVSCAGDYRIEVRDLNTNNISLSCSCHSERVKRIATLHSSPYFFFSASEDGTVMQFDTREKHTCSSRPNVLINLKHHSGRLAECKCLTCHPIRPEFIAIGASDPYVRVYDRRKINLTTIQNSTGSWSRRNFTSRLDVESSPDNLPLGCVQYFVPGHLPAKMKEYFRKYRSLSTTYLTYSGDGRHLLANLGGDHVYLFDTLGAELPRQFLKEIDASRSNEDRLSVDSYKVRKVCNGHSSSYQFYSYEDDFSQPLLKSISPRAEAIRYEAAAALKARQYSKALRLYNEIIRTFDSLAPLYCARAATLISRRWDGDLYSALRDYNKAIELEPENVRTKMRFAWCLYLLGRELEMDNYLLQLCLDCPELNTSPLLVELKDKISKTSQNLSTNKAKHSEREKEEDAFLIPPITKMEKLWRSKARDYEVVFNGHCNTTTDIKESVFIGKNEDFIAAGSDDGNLFIWDRHSSNLVRVFEADKSIVNCVQSHPGVPLMATSGIETVIKLWAPSGEGDDPEHMDEEKLSNITSENQRRMSTDPMEMMFLHMGEFLEAEVRPRRGGDDDEVDSQFPHQCRQA